MGGKVDKIALESRVLGSSPHSTSCDWASCFSSQSLSTITVKRSIWKQIFSKTFSSCHMLGFSEVCIVQLNAHPVGRGSQTEFPHWNQSFRNVRHQCKFLPGFLPPLVLNRLPKCYILTRVFTALLVNLAVKLHCCIWDHIPYFHNNRLDKP